jgi:hypothetical protein
MAPDSVAWCVELHAIKIRPESKPDTNTHNARLFIASALNHFDKKITITQRIGYPQTRLPNLSAAVSAN